MQEPELNYITLPLNLSLLKSITRGFFRFVTKIDSCSLCRTSFYNISSIECFKLGSKLPSSIIFREDGISKNYSSMEMEFPRDENSSGCKDEIYIYLPLMLEFI